MQADPSKKRSAERFCPICRIDLSKSAGTWTKRERRIRFHFHAVRVVASIHLLIAMGTLIKRDEIEDLNTLLISLFIIINILIAILLHRFSLLGYRIAVTFYFFCGITSTVNIQRGSGEQFIAIILVLIGLYLIGNQTAKALFTRSVDSI